jgi:hypothetical protein
MLQLNLMTSPIHITNTIVSDLSSAESERVERGLLTAFFVLEQTRRYAAYDQQEGAATGENRDEWVERLRSEYKAYFDAVGFPADYLGLILSDDQIDVIVRALLEQLEHQDARAQNAVAAIAVSGRVWVVPRLTKLVRDHVQDDTLLSRDAIQAIGKILRENSIRPSAAAATDEDQIINDAVETLRFAAAHGTSGPLRAREQAELELASLTKTS